MTFSPPWLSRGQSFSTLLDHPNLHVSSGSLDGIVWAVVLASVLTLAVYRIWRGRILQGVVVVGLLFILLMSSGSLKPAEATLVLHSKGDEVLAIALGCTVEQLGPQGCPGDKLSDAQMSRLLAVLDKAAQWLNRQECAYVAASIHESIACAKYPKPISLRRAIGAAEPGLPSNSCQEFETSTTLTHRKAFYVLPDGGLAAGLQERNTLCFDNKALKMEFVPSSQLWEKDLQWLLHVGTANSRTISG